MPASTTTLGEKARRRHSPKISRMEAAANKNASSDAAKGLTPTSKLAGLWPVLRKPPAKAMMDRLAPNTAAWDTPSVEGEAMALPSEVCMRRPDTDRPAPAMSAASNRGMRMPQMIRAAVPPVRPSRASRHADTVMPEEPTMRQPKAASTTAQARRISTAVFLCVWEVLPSMGASCGKS